LGVDEILVEFLNESKQLTEELIPILEKVEEDPTHYKEFDTFGQIIDRIMGGAAVLALDRPAGDPVHMIAKFTELCKVIGYKASQVNNPELATITASFLIDASETLLELYEQIKSGQAGSIGEYLTETFLDRLKWLAKKFDDSLSGSIAVTKESAASAQDDIDAILKQMGMK
jgi:hypothetical protein